MCEWLRRVYVRYCLAMLVETIRAFWVPSWREKERKIRKKLSGRFSKMLTWRAWIISQPAMMRLTRFRSSGKKWNYCNSLGGEPYSPSVWARLGQEDCFELTVSLGYASGRPCLRKETNKQKPEEGKGKERRGEDGRGPRVEGKGRGVMEERRKVDWVRGREAEKLNCLVE